MGRAYSVSEVLKKKFKGLPFEGKWRDAIGTPELRGSWIIWGNSFNGKTSMAMQLAKYLTTFDKVKKVAYNTLEEGLSLSVQKAFQRENMSEVGQKLVLIDGETIPELSERLKKKKSPNVIIIDSLQHAGITYAEYKKFLESHPRKLFIWLSHADGKEPAGSVAKSIRYDSFVKIRVENYVATCLSRYNPDSGSEYVIWEEGAKQFS